LGDVYSYASLLKCDGERRDERDIFSFSFSNS
jgi:hypothetical protein